jgi:lysophospholipase L1-like esterase
MAEEGGQEFPGAGPPGAKPGWYRSKKSGQRRFWDGESWTSLSEVITPFTFEPPVAPVEPPPPVPPPPSGPGGKKVDTRRKVIAASAAAAAVALVIVGAINLSDNPSPVSTATPSPSVASAASPLATTTTFPVDTTLPSDVITAPLDVTNPAVAATNPGAPAVTGAAASGPVVDVAIIGDSISQQAARNMTHTLRQYKLYFDTLGGSKMAEHLSKIEQVASDGQPRYWVIELGTNDVLAGNPNWTSDFANEVTALQGQRCVVFLTVNPRFGVMSSGMNEAIGNAVATHGNFHLLDWGNIEFHNSQWLQSDGIHPTKLGDAELARLVRKAVFGCQGR